MRSCATRRIVSSVSRTCRRRLHLSRARTPIGPKGRYDAHFREPRVRARELVVRCLEESRAPTIFRRRKHCREQAGGIETSAPWALLAGHAVPSASASLCVADARLHERRGCRCSEYCAMRVSRALSSDPPCVQGAIARFRRSVPRTEARCEGGNACERRLELLTYHRHRRHVPAALSLGWTQTSYPAHAICAGAAPRA